MYKKSRNLVTCEIAGEQYYDFLEVADKLKTGAKLRLEYEADNPYDPNAVALYFNDSKIGYIARKNNEIISTLLIFGHGDILEAFFYLKSQCHSPQVVVKIKDKKK